ncbi:MULTISPECIES: hypothetical protein [Vibrio]|uniref:Uncharacterized protein n=1 Tax=Vibrio qingdaonensis TaxID=2829491 RepID=A0A9X3CRT4_9VIBR|nr:hypothetical protein [Vibrio qingdaonensis]MCW8347325.1 hypothetical protein [Vibrio qingdaonensis]
MDRELLARKLYDQRVSKLIGDKHVDSQRLDLLWEEKVSPQHAVEHLKSSEEEHSPPTWLSRYLNRH